LLPLLKTDIGLFLSADRSPFEEWRHPIASHLVVSIPKFRQARRWSYRLLCDMGFVPG
jgi:hypothetical protein